MKYILQLHWCRIGKSPPSRGAWIEIVWGVSDMAAQINVAPLAGGVD